MSNIIICISCGKIIGCGIVNGCMKYSCLHCDVFEKCRNAVPKGAQGTANVIFVHFDNECLGHERERIGFSHN